MATDVSGDMVTVAATDGTVVMIDARSGQESWRANAGAPLVAGVGSDGSLVAVVTANNELVAMQGGKVLWKQRLTAQSYTAPLVAGRRVFVQAADRSTSAWDGQSGRRLWAQQRTAENLVLKSSGVLIAVGDTLVTGVGGRLVGINPANGTSRWESPIAAPRGTNDVERLVDLTGSVSRVGDTVCARAYYASVGCVDTSRGALLWSKPATGADGVSGDDRFIYGTEENGNVVAWRRADGERAWQIEPLQVPRAHCAARGRPFAGHRRQHRACARGFARRRRAAEPPHARWLGHRRDAGARRQHGRGRHPQWRCVWLSALNNYFLKARP